MKDVYNYKNPILTNYKRHRETVTNHTHIQRKGSALHHDTGKKNVSDTRIAIPSFNQNTSNTLMPMLFITFEMHKHTKVNKYSHVITTIY